MRVLIVEDDPKIASFVAKGLKQAGYAVDRAANGQAGAGLGPPAPEVSGSSACLACPM